MGAHHSKIFDRRGTKIIDHGSTKPLGLYQPNGEYDSKRIQELIETKRLSPFYKGKKKKLPFNEPDKSVKSIKSDKSHKRRFHIRRKEHSDSLYQNAIECPICFLYYPANINFTRCCDQPICTECFVQIKKNPSDFRRDIDCPYCMTDSFGVVYYRFSLDKKKSVSSEIRSTTSGVTSHDSTRRKSLDSNHPSVVLIDHMKPTIKRKGNKRKTRSRANTVSFDRRLSDSMMDSMTLQDMIVFRAISHSLIDTDTTIHSQP
ncbi:Protein sip5 [Choanephora cucurbitarum]|uniref:Protein sip5 n=1 Tax=Choanephora cucurbitarum TaxID=101091 RepID=A0A1C7N8J8_9FUNG|nr:Protein sip5 [Choanephora cucurbitarum]